MQVLEAMKATKAFTKPSLIYVSACLNGKAVVGMVDGGATHSFCSDKLIEKLVFKVEKYSTQVNVVNSESHVVTHMTQVQVKVDQWESSIDFLVVTMDDFDFILINNLFINTTVSVMPYVCGMMINDSKKPSFVQGFHEVPKSARSSEFVSAMQLSRGWKKGVPTYLCFIREVGDSSKV